MVKLVINDVSIDFIGTHNPINFYYNLIDNRFNQYEGELNLKEIFYSGNNIENIKTIKLICNNNILDLSNFKSILISKTNKLLSINLKFENIFKVFEKATIFFNKIFKGSISTYNCFATSMNCNLSCPYCIYSCSNKTKHSKPNYYLADYYITKVIKIIDTICKPEKETIRIMGGETLLDLKDFKKAIEYAKSVTNPIDDIWIYTNLTVNIKEFVSIIDNYLKENISKKITIIFTSDSFNYLISKRIPNKEIMNNFKNNVEYILDYYKSNDRVTTASNLMYISDEECYNTAKELYRLGLKFLQISYDEFTNRSIIENITKKVHNIYCRLEKEGIKRLKQNLGTTMWFQFFIDNGINNIYQCKYSFKADYVISKFNDY